MYRMVIRGFLLASAAAVVLNMAACVSDPEVPQTPGEGEPSGPSSTGVSDPAYDHEKWNYQDGDSLLHGLSSRVPGVFEFPMSGIWSDRYAVYAMCAPGVTMFYVATSADESGEGTVFDVVCDGVMSRGETAFDPDVTVFETLTVTVEGKGDWGVALVDFETSE
ncbi:MAG TPA: hypothetical protein PKE40_04215 [Arachnia sp.]|nr:hypothetical protein [Arachnia sp.]HMT85537.1 hypothetical protein [Arachnia sp.]